MPGIQRNTVQRKTTWVCTCGLWATGMLAWTAWNGSRVALAGPENNPTAARQLRQTPVTEVAPSPLPKGVPLVDIGKSGIEKHGLPTQYVDGPALRSLLYHRQYDSLSKAFEQLQRQFEADPRKEWWPLDAASAFASAEPALREALNAWAAATPNSFAPYVAQGAYLNAVAWARRGHRYAKDTPADDFKAMTGTFREALASFSRALERCPRSIAAWHGRLTAYRGLGLPDEGKAALAQALKQCPSCFAVRAEYMKQLRPRWHGSRQALVDFARENRDASPLARVLEGFAEWDEAVTLGEASKWVEAADRIEKACARGDYWEFLDQRAKIYAQLGDFKRAIRDNDRAVAMRPGDPDLLLSRHYTLWNLGRIEDAGRDLLASLRTRPTSEGARLARDGLVQNLNQRGWEKYRAGDRPSAVAIYNLAAELDPSNRDLMQRRAFVLEGRTTGPSDPNTNRPVDYEALARKVRDNPDDLLAHQQLDYNLSRQGRFPEIVQMWTTYLQRHPNDGRAYLERGGAYFQQRKMAEAKADARRACDLGISEGCRHAK